MSLNIQSNYSVPHNYLAFKATNIQTIKNINSKAKLIKKITAYRWTKAYEIANKIVDNLTAERKIYMATHKPEFPQQRQITYDGRLIFVLNKSVI